MPATALTGYLIFLALAFGLRSVLHYRRTGRTGFVGLSGRPGSAEWLGGALLIVSLAGGLAAPVLELTSVLEPWAVLSSRGVQLLGLACFALGLGATLWAQLAMGDSWRIGVDQAERTSLVSSGPFRLVRNPIFTSMMLASLGLALMVPNVVSFGALAILVIALEMHVRLVEEPYLVRTQGVAYLRYAARAGRFVPGVGRLDARPLEGAPS
jgi:protein-S-isoprenylcysteine O-methyltransferase Ste14